MAAGDVELGAVKARLEADTSDLEQGLRRATDALNKVAESSEQSASAIGLSVAAWQTLFKVAEVTANALIGAYNASIQLSHELTNLSARTQVGVEALQKYKLAGDDVGVSIDRLSMSIFRMQKSLAEGKGDSILRQLGLDPDQLRAAAPDKAFEAMGNAILRVGNASQQAALSTKLLGDRGGQALQFLRAGGLDAANEMERLGVVMSGTTVKALNEVWKEADDLNDVWQGLIRNIGLTIAPTEVQAGILQGLKEAFGVASKALQDWNAEQQRSPDLQARTAQATFNWATGMVDVAHAVVTAWYAIKAGVSDVLAWIADKIASLGEVQVDFIGTLAKIPGPQQGALKEYATTLQAGVDFYKSWAYAEKQASQDAVASADKTLSAIEAIQKRLAGTKIGAASAGAKGGITYEPPSKERAVTDRLAADLLREGERQLTAARKADAEVAAQVTKAEDALAAAMARELSPLDAAIEAIRQKTDAQVVDITNAYMHKAAAEGVSDALWKERDATIATANAAGDLAIANLKAAENEKTRVFAIQEAEKIMQAQIRDGTASIHEQYEARRAEIELATRSEIEQIQKRLAVTTDPRLRAELEAQIAAWLKIRDAEISASKGAEQYIIITKGLSDVASILKSIDEIFTMLGGNADSTFGRIISGVQGMVAGLQNAAGILNTLGKGAGIGAGFKNMLAGLSGKGGFGGVLEGLSGAFSLASTAVSIGKAIFGIFSKPEYKKIMSDVGKGWGVSISEGLAKQIEQIEKTHHISRTMAELLNVSKIMEESGQDPRQFGAKIDDLMNAIKLGSVPATEGLAELGKAFTMVADSALKAGTVGDAALVAIIKRARELGELTPEMKEFIGTQLAGAAEGVKAMVEALPPETQAAAAGQAALLAATFNAIAAEKGIVEASNAIGPSFDKLLEQITKAGLAIPESLQAISRQMDLGRNPQFAAASAGAAATSQVLRGIANAGYMDTSVLTGAGDVAKQAFDQAKAAGATDKEAYQLIGALLSDIKNASIQSGMALSDVEKQLVSGAAAAGVKVGEDQLSVLIQIRDALTGGGGGGGGGGGTVTTGGGTMTPEAAIASFTEGRTRIRPTGYQHGSGGIQDFGAGTLAVLHGKEAVMTEGEAAATMAQGQTTVSYSPSFHIDPLMNFESRAALGKFLIDEFWKASRNDPRLKYAVNRAANGGR